MNADAAMTKGRGEFSQIAFLFDPKLDPIKDNVKSFVVLKSLMGCDKPLSLEEVKEICSDSYKIELASEELSDIINKWYAYIDTKNGGIMLTKQGIELVHGVEKGYIKIQDNGFDWFKEELSKFVAEEKIKNNEDKLKRLFMKCVSRASEVDVNILMGIGGTHHPLIDAPRCVERIQHDGDFIKLDEDVKNLKAFTTIIKKIFENPSDERISRFMYSLQYASLICFVLPNTGIIDLLKKDLANKKFCLDSNTILSAIFHHDRNHFLIYNIFSKLKQLNDGRLPIFWHDDTHNSVRGVLKASKEFCENLGFFPEDLINNVCLVASKSPIREYFKEKWPNWRSFEKYYMDRYRQLKKHDLQTISKINKIGIDEPLLKKTKRSFNEYLEGRGKNKSAKELAHDSLLLVWIHQLRQSDPSEDITPNYWLITMDNALINFEREYRGKLFNPYFTWDNVPEIQEDSKKLLWILKMDFDIGWTKDVEIRKSDDGKTIHIFKDENSAEIMIDEKKEKATLKISDGQLYGLKVKKENGNLNIYFRFEEYRFEEYPLCVSKRALHLLLDPYFLAGSTKIQKSFNKEILGISAAMKGDRAPFYSIEELHVRYRKSSLTEQIRLIGEYLDKENLRDTITHEVSK